MTQPGSAQLTKSEDYHAVETSRKFDNPREQQGNAVRDRERVTPSFMAPGDGPYQRPSLELVRPCYRSGRVDERNSPERFPTIAPHFRQKGHPKSERG